MTAQDPRTADELLDAVGPAFAKLRRTAALQVRNPLSAKDFSRTLVLNQVLEHSREPGAEVTVGRIAELLGADPSVASRMVADNIEAGYLIRAASQLDGRRTVLRVTPAGDELMARFRRHQREAFDRVTAEWPESDRLTFARLMLRYVDSLEALRDRDPADDS